VTSYTDTVYTVQTIVDDAWNYGGQMGNGDIGIGSAATTIVTYGLAGDSGFLLETGPVTHQSWIGGQAGSTGELYIGGGDYSTLFDDTASTTLTLTEVDGAYPLDNVSFGAVTLDETTLAPSTGYMEELGYQNQTQSAIIATNFVGLGLPDYLWYQVVNLFYKIDSTFNTELTCDASAGGACKLANACETYTNLWTAGYSFNILFAGQTDYINMPLGALSADVADNLGNVQCYIYVQYLNEEQNVQSTQPIFGSMFLQ
jgi:hypothetical protein